MEKKISLKEPLVAIFYNARYENEKPAEWEMWWDLDFDKEINDQKLERFKSLDERVPGVLNALKGKVLDAGCGSGQLVKFIKDNYKGKVYGIDPSKKAINLGKSKGIDNLMLGSIEESLPFSRESFDIIISKASLFSEVSSLNNKKAFTNLLPYLKKGGFLYADPQMTFTECGNVNSIPLKYYNEIHYTNKYKGILVNGVKAFNNYVGATIILQKTKSNTKAQYIPIKDGKFVVDKKETKWNF